MDELPFSSSSNTTPCVNIKPHMLFKTVAVNRFSKRYFRQMTITQIEEKRLHVWMQFVGIFTVVPLRHLPEFAIWPENHTERRGNTRYPSSLAFSSWLGNYATNPAAWRTAHILKLCANRESNRKRNGGLGVLLTAPSTPAKELFPGHAMARQDPVEEPPAWSDASAARLAFVGQGGCLGCSGVPSEASLAAGLP